MSEHTILGMLTALFFVYAAVNSVLLVCMIAQLFQKPNTKVKA
jgi:hypothetical protein